MTLIDVVIILYKTPEAGLDALLASLGAQRDAPDFTIHLHSNAASADLPALSKVIAAHREAGLKITITGSDQNLGFGRAINQVAETTAAPFLLLLNHDTRIRVDAIARLWAAAAKDDAGAMWEMRQAPFEHPKAYDPVTLETEWCSGAAVMIRRSAFDEIGGFEPRIFMYGEDVDLSWRLRARGHRLRYVPMAVAEHDTYQSAGETKPLQVLGSTLANLYLRIRFGARDQIVEGFRMMWREAQAPEEFPGRRRGMRRNLWLGLKNFGYFARDRKRWAKCGFKPAFAGWDYGLRRDGAFIPVPSKWPDPEVLPLVSIIVRTHRRPDFLRRALLSLVRQSYPRIEVVVVEDGEPHALAMIEAEFKSILDLRYHATGAAAGRSKAGNLGLELARGDWLGFLDDDDEFFADHIEVVLGAALAAGAGGAYGLAWDTHTEVVSKAPLELVEHFHHSSQRTPFNRLAMWRFNLMPIQSVLFARRLFERHGGFDTSMDQLEDWNLWTRYTLDEDFVLVDKTTSKYRTPFDAEERHKRQIKLDQAYGEAVARQITMKIVTDPQSLVKLADQHRPEPVRAYLATTPARQIMRDKAAIALGQGRRWWRSLVLALLTR